MNKESDQKQERERRRRQLREDARRPMAVNLAETIELSEFVSTFPEEERPGDADAREMLKRRKAVR